ncbi:choice-of-anchor Q domain-containing protein [Dysgonomonas sp. 520]|uniref:choice-of-anchor Q domain-containing protein n=1 Tax=Dysgonomonas sp. 520 TaxID=2302931 RepID=UPI0013D3C0C3|nr:choice-of-anchor Q domain-containing protein [Dysgonomonas sp. 520]NDW09147.1 hypothetical protein [Dysgonomonas sp. 520]
MKSIKYIVLIITLSFIFASCEDDTFSISDDSGMRIEFSSDTLRIDTIFTSLGSATRRLKVYNHNNDGLKLESVKLMGAGQTGFRMNVDGIAGDEVNNVNVYKKDSILILLEITVDPLNSNSPLLIRDSIQFKFNGNTQYVQLEAVGQDAIVWNKKTISEDTTITAEKPYLIYDTLTIEKGATFNIEKNVRLHFHNGAKMVVNGKINSKGTLDEPVYFRGDRYDRVMSNVPYNNIPGQWDGIEVDSLSFGNHFEYTHIRGTSNGILFRHSDTSEVKATFLNSVVHNSLTDVVSATNCKIIAQNSLFSNGKGATVRLIGGSYQFTHCTVVNYYSWWGGHDKALIIGNIIDEMSETPEIVPLGRCDFFNCIVSGSGGSEIAFQNKIKGNVANVQFEHLFRNCIIKSKGEDDKNFINTIWNEDPKFVNINDDKDDTNYNYNFNLTAESPAIDKADITYSLSLPLDMNGVSRLSDNRPDIGCYEWVEPEEEIKQ